MKETASQTRRAFVFALIGSLVTVSRGRGAVEDRQDRAVEHPQPRPGIDGSNVLSADDLAGHPDLVDVYDGIRAIPEIADGIRCACGCAEDPAYRSLLTCYESGRMALFCDICKAEGRMTVRLHADGRTLDQIRAALDARFG